MSIPISLATEAAREQGRVSVVSSARGEDEGSTPQCQHHILEMGNVVLEGLWAWVDSSVSL